MNAIQLSVIRVLLYFDHFAHPLNRKELFDLISSQPDEEEFIRDLDDLIATGYIAYESGYYFIPNGKTNINDRLQKLKKAEKYFHVAIGVSKLIFWHPFVRGVFISGSLSKSTVSKKDDIDFFVITEPGRLWVCRTFLMLFKKIFLLNSKKYFCINYFVDSDNLEIPERNLFTAVELTFLRPLQNPGLYMQLMSRNNWIFDFFPNKTFHPNGCRSMNDPWLKRKIEYFLRGRAGDRLDNWFMKIYQNRSKRKYGTGEEQFLELNFRSRKNVSKHHPNGYQQKILDEYTKTVTEFEQRKGISLTIHQKSAG